MFFPHDENSGLLLTTSKCAAVFQSQESFIILLPYNETFVLFDRLHPMLLTHTLVKTLKSGLSFWVCLLLKPSPRVTSWRWLVRNTATQHLRAHLSTVSASAHTAPCDCCPPECARLTLHACLLWLSLCLSLPRLFHPPPPTPPPLRHHVLDPTDLDCLSPAFACFPLWIHLC